jgi:DNA-binding NarL/FixJ family response regulator
MVSNDSPAPLLLESAKHDFIMEERIPTPHLTSREIRIINLAKDCLTNKEIADQLQIEVSTVKCHRRNLFKKLGLKGKTDFAKFLFSKMSHN